MAQQQPSESGFPPGLYITATPIGAADDITLRALATLKAADIVLCEDTRVTAKLLARHQLQPTTASYHDHSPSRVRDEVVKRIAAGDVVVLVSDAGTPLIADPGYRLVRAVQDAGLLVRVVPGASAVTAALAVSGLPTDRFFFAGFLPKQQPRRRRELLKLAAIPATLVFFESARRLPGSLSDMAAILGERPAMVARELTKVFEESVKGSLAELAAHYSEPPRGEVVVVVAPPSESDPMPDEELDALLQESLPDGVRDAVAAVTRKTGESRRRVYSRALALRRSGKQTGGQTGGQAGGQT